MNKFKPFSDLLCFLIVYYFCIYLLPRVFKGLMISIPYFDFIFFALIAVFLSISLFKKIQNIKARSSDSFMAISHKNDNGHKVFLVFFGSLILLIESYSITKMTLSNFNWNVLSLALVGLYAFISGVLFGKSVLLKKSNDSIIVEGQDIEIGLNTKELEFRVKTIKVINRDGDIQELKELDLRYEEIPKISDWIDHQLKGNKISFVRINERRE